MHKSFFKKPKAKPKGSKTEAPVQAALDTFLELKGLYYFRIPDLVFKILLKELRKSTNIYWQIQIKKLLLTLKGWPDNIAFIPLNDKYLIAVPIECKSATGTTHGRQKNMARDLNYQITRSPEEAMEIVNLFVKDAKEISDKLDSESCALYVDYIKSCQALKKHFEESGN